MNRPRTTERRPGRTDEEGGRRPFQKKRFCRFCKDKELRIDYKDAKALRPYITDRGKIMPRRITGTCAKHQRVVAKAVKQARILAIVPISTTSLFH